MTFSADNSTLAIQSLGNATFWNLGGGKLLHQVQPRVHGLYHQGPSLSGDGKIAVVALARNDGRVEAIEIATGKTISSGACIHNQNVRTAISSDGTTMVTWGQLTGDDRVAEVGDRREQALKMLLGIAGNQADAQQHHCECRTRNRTQ